MSTLLAVEETISSFQVLHDRLGLSRATDASFFAEWQGLDAEQVALPDRAFLDHLQQRYHNYYNAGLLTAAIHRCAATRASGIP